MYSLFDFYYFNSSSVFRTHLISDVRIFLLLHEKRSFFNDVKLVLRNVVPGCLYGFLLSVIQKETLDAVKYIFCNYDDDNKYNNNIHNNY